MTHSISAPDPDFVRLVDWFRATGGALVAFSGGVDSGLVLAAAVDALGERALAVTATSPTYSPAELARAKEVAALLSARHRTAESCEFDDPAFVANPPDRCYHCKKELYGILRAIAAEEGLATLVDGSNADDAADHRPGRRATREAAVRSPLCELNLGKEAVRRMARARGLPTWSLPAAACLASRIPYGEAITPERIARVGEAEAAVAALGFRVVRVRDHGQVARVELSPDEIARALDPALRARLAAACRAAGFPFVALDLEGYRTGSLNETLPESARETGR